MPFIEILPIVMCDQPVLLGVAAVEVLLDERRIPILMIFSKWPTVGCFRMELFRVVQKCEVFISTALCRSTAQSEPARRERRGSIFPPSPTCEMFQHQSETLNVLTRQSNPWRRQFEAQAGTIFPHRNTSFVNTFIGRFTIASLFHAFVKCRVDMYRVP